MPPPLPPREAPPLPEEPDAKRPRTDTFVLTAEEEFADQHPGQQKVRGCVEGCRACLLCLLARDERYTAGRRRLAASWPTCVRCLASSRCGYA
jgi:hypothetical protein